MDATKVLFNLMMRLKQHFRENKDFANAFQNDKPAYYHAEHYFRSKITFLMFFLECISYNSLGKLVTDYEPKKEEKRN